MPFHTALPWPNQNLIQSLKYQKTLHTSPSRASYGVSFVSILENIDRVITAPQCIRCKVCVIPSSASMPETIYCMTSFRCLFLHEIYLHHQVTVLGFDKDLVPNCLHLYHLRCFERSLYVRILHLFPFYTNESKQVSIQGKWRRSWWRPVFHQRINLRISSENSDGNLLF